MCTIPPMTRSGTRNYIRTRLRMAGARDLGIFTDDAVEHIVEYANGIPRVGNTVCDHCLLIGYADQTRRIDRGIVDPAIGHPEACPPPPLRPPRPPCLRGRPRPRLHPPALRRSQ